jgi:hypothetical protein
MKNLLLIPVFLVLTCLTGCDAVEGLKFQNLVVPGTMSFNIVSSDNNEAILSDTIDLSKNSDFMNNKSKIENLEVKDITFKMTRLETGAADTIVDGKLEVLNPATGNYEALTSYTNKKLVLSQEELVVYNTAVTNVLINSVKNSPHRAIFRYNVKMNKKPVNMDIEFTVRYTLKIKV